METIYYEQTDEYENAAQPGEYAYIIITRDDDGPHFKFGCGQNIILDLPVPYCEALAIAYALAQSGQDSIDAARRVVDDQPDHQHVDHAAQVPDMTDYGPREIDPRQFPKQVQGKPDPASLPHADPTANYTRALPAQGYSPPASWTGPTDIPKRRSA